MLFPFLSRVELEGSVDRRASWAEELAVPVEERRGAVSVVDRGPVEVAAAVRVRLGPAVVEDAAVIPTVLVVQRRLARLGVGQGVPRGQEDRDQDQHAVELHRSGLPFKQKRYWLPLYRAAHHSNGSACFCASS